MKVNTPEMTKWNRKWATTMAKNWAKSLPESYYQEPFEPHEWVIQAIWDAFHAGMAAKQEEYDYWSGPNGGNNR